MKPKLLFFQYKYDDKLPVFLLIHKQEHVRCLSEFFEVTVITEDCDYQELCEKHEPDLALFETGVNHVTCRKLSIANLRSCSNVPKVALHNADSFCNARAGFLSDIEHLQVEAVFAICTTAAEHTPEISDYLFAWPNCINPQVFNDYKLFKSIPVLFTGNTTSLYPWRQKILKIVSEKYPSLICPHPGYDPRSVVSQIMHGENYARLINASMFVPACGTVVKELVRKHLEIPGSNACLVTEKSPILEAAGFVDMQNCVFADQSDILDKMGHLFRNPDKLQEITRSGFQLVHERHTFKNRGQIFEWYTLNKSRLANQRIVQVSPFEPLKLVQNAPAFRSSHVHGGGMHLDLLRQGDLMLRAHRYADAERLYLQCLNYLRWFPEARLRVAVCKLAQGDHQGAKSWLTDLLQFVLGHYKAVDPDPVEWAYYSVSVLCEGKLDEAFALVHKFPHLEHPELFRMRWLLAALKGREKAANTDSAVTIRKSLHLLPFNDPSEWLELMAAIFQACGQLGYGQTLRSKFPDLLPLEAAAHRKTNDACSLTGPNSTGEKSIDHETLKLFSEKALRSGQKANLRSTLSRTLHRLEKRFGYFLPYHLSEIRNDEFYFLLQKTMQEETLSSALLLGAASGVGTTEAFLSGLLQNSLKPRVFCLNMATRMFQRLQNRFQGQPQIKFQVITSTSSTSPAGLQNFLSDSLGEGGLEFVDALVIDLSECEKGRIPCRKLDFLLHRARFVFLRGINSVDGYEIHHYLFEHPDYALISHDPGQGYAAFKKSESTRNPLDKPFVCKEVITL